MVSFEEARRLILERAAPVEPILQDLEDATGSGVADPLHARLDSPRFDNSAVDGYGLRVAEQGTPLRLAGASVAGGKVVAGLQPGTCVRVLTGAPIPQGVEAVAMQEDCEISGDVVTVRSPVAEGQNIRRAGEEYREGDLLVAAGAGLTPPVIGLFASNGLTRARVPRPLQIAVFSTGDELCEPGEALGKTSIYDSNGPALTAALGLMGAWPVMRGRLDDDPQQSRLTLGSALREADVLIVTGGVSVGDRDFVKEALADLGVERVFWRVNMKPGKPFFFGVQGRKLVFGLPGNPVSALVTLHLLVRPALRKMQGHAQVEDLMLPARLAFPLRKREGRAEFVRARVANENGALVVRPTEGQGSHMVAGIASADCLIHLPPGDCDLPAGAEVSVSLLRWGAL